MSTEFLRVGVACGLVLISVIGLVFIVNRLGFRAWVWWTSRDKHKAQDSSAKRYWSAHE